MIELLKPEGFLLIVDWDGAVERPVGPPRGHVYSAGEAKERLENFGLEVEILERLRYHFVLRARPG